MLVLPVRIGETTTITAPNGDTILVLMTEHRTSLDEPLLGFQVPKDYAVLRDRVKERIQTELQRVNFYLVTNRMQQSMVIASYQPDDAVEVYRRRFPYSSDIRISRIETETGNYWYARLTENLLSKRKPPFVIEVGE